MTSCPSAASQAAPAQPITPPPMMAMRAISGGQRGLGGLGRGAEHDVAGHAAGQEALDLPHHLPGMGTGQAVEASGGEDKTTNNRMEMTGVIEGLRALPTATHVRLVADSQYVLHGIRDWLPGWKKRGWRKADKKPVLNADLWQEIDRLLTEHDITVEWTRGHAGHVENERCDELATAEAAKRMRR